MLRCDTCTSLYRTCGRRPPIQVPWRLQLELAQFLAAFRALPYLPEELEQLGMTAGRVVDRFTLETVAERAEIETGAVVEQERRRVLQVAILHWRAQREGAAQASRKGDQAMPAPQRLLRLLHQDADAGTRADRQAPQCVQDRLGVEQQRVQVARVDVHVAPRRADQRERFG